MPVNNKYGVKTGPDQVLLPHSYIDTQFESLGNSLRAKDSSYTHFSPVLIQSW